MRLGRSKLAAVTGAALALLASSSAALDAQGAVAGRVVAKSSSAPLSDVRVLLVGGNQFAITAADGRYTIRNVSNGAHEVRVVRVGFQEQKQPVTVTAGQTVTLDFTMTDVVVQLQEVVTTATGEQRKVELGNQVTTLGDVSKKVETGQIANLGDLLVAKAPGVVVLPGNMTGSAPTVRIRGLNSLAVNGSGISNAPIYIVDGIRINSGSINNVSTGGTQASFLNDISPEEIADVEIVKGPSAATLYGTDAANGVIVISTKKGRAGAAQWHWYAEGGVVDDRNSYPSQYANWGHTPANPGTQTRCTLVTISSGACVVDSLTSYNVLLNPSTSPIATGHRDQYGAQVSGGSDVVRFFISGDMENEIGPVKMPQFSVDRFNAAGVSVRDEWKYPEAFQRENFRTNLQASPTGKIDVSMNVGFSKTDQRLPQVDNNSFSYFYNALRNPGFNHPGLGYTGVGSLGEQLNGYAQFTPGDIMQRVVEQGIQRILGSSNASWRPFTWMQNDGTVGIDLAARDNLTLCHFNECPNSGATRLGSITDRHENNRNFTAKAASTATWQARSWANLKTTAGADYINIENDFTTATGSTLPPTAQTVGAAAVVGANNALPTAVKTLGVYAQEQFSFNDRLFLIAAVRSDQNSAFGTKFQRVFYPKFSGSWIVSDESFFPRIRFMDQLRLRAAYGASGVQPGATAALQTFGTAVNNIATPAGTSGIDTPGLIANALGNQNLKPERSAETEVGFEVALFGSRAHFDFTYYAKKTQDAIVAKPIAASAAPANLVRVENIASVENSGLEATLTTTILNYTNLGWDITIGGSHNSNKVASLGKDPVTGLNNPTIGTGATRDSLGLPVNAWLIRPYRFSDANKDGIITASEVTVDTSVTFLGYSNPRDVLTVQSGFDFLRRRLRVNVLLDYKGGFGLFDNTTQFYCQQTNQCHDTNVKGTALDRQAAFVANSLKNPNSIAGYLESGQFWRLREVAATVSLPTTLASKLRARDVGLSFAARNLKVWSNYTGTDPEANYATGDVQTDFNTTAPPTYFTLRLNLHY
jgi:TonB-linked SusC/RagA family outer membrane protein